MSGWKWMIAMLVWLCFAEGLQAFPSDSGEQSQRYSAEQLSAFAGLKQQSDSMRKDLQKQIRMVVGKEGLSIREYRRIQRNIDREQEDKQFDRRQKDAYYKAAERVKALQKDFKKRLKKLVRQQNMSFKVFQNIFRRYKQQAAFRERVAQARQQE